MCSTWRWRYVYHLVDERNLTSIRAKGLRSAAALVSGQKLDLETAHNLLRRQRRTEIQLPGGPVLRDQRPIPLKALRSCLVGCEPSEWYEQLNQWVYFWLDPRRVERQLRACTRSQWVMVLDAPRLIAHRADRAHVTPINTGAALRRPALRSPASFVPIRQWAKDGWTSETGATGRAPRAGSSPPVELVIRDAVADVDDYIVDVLDTTSWDARLASSDPLAPVGRSGW